MKREPRLRKKWTWLAWMILSGLLLLVVGCAILAQSLLQINVIIAQKFSGLLQSVPFVSWLVEHLPQGPSPLFMSWSIVIELIVIIPLAVSASRFYHHYSRYKDEEKARDLRDL